MLMKYYFSYIKNIFMLKWFVLKNLNHLKKLSSGLKKCSQILKYCNYSNDLILTILYSKIWSLLSRSSYRASERASNLSSISYISISISFLYLSTKFLFYVFFLDYFLLGLFCKTKDILIILTLIFKSIF